MAAPTTEELTVLKQFREKVADLNLENESDLYMLRWLRARELNIPQSEDMLRRNLKWKKEENISQILEWEAPPEYKVKYGYEIAGRDSYGHPICLVPFGDWDIKKALKKGTKQIWLRNLDQMFYRIFERMKELSIEFNKEITQCILIVDFGNFSMRQLTSIANVNTILEAVRRFEANYAEILYKFYFINAFRVFQLFFALMKPLLSKRTVAKLEIYTTPDKWLPVLLSYLPADQLPKGFGFGKNQTENSVMPGGKVFDGLEMITVNITPGDKLEFEYGITNVNTIIKWKFITETDDIDFFILYERKDEILAKKRYTPQAEDFTGSFTCDKTGEYFLIFDNTYDKIREKTINYTVEILDPENENSICESTDL